MIEKLNEKVAALLDKYNALKSELIQAKNELSALREGESEKDQLIKQLQEENAMKDLEIEEIVNKIESILG
jgi:SMC interacting uncharacterized protein involved in chromosome segregation